MIGWIKLHRKLRDWQWYDDHNATRLLIHLLISVNYDDKKWKGILIKSGSIVTSWEHLSKDCGLSIQQTRTSMSKLEKSGEVTRKVTNKFQLITLIKWEELQENNNQLTDELTSHQQTSNNQVTTTKEDNNKRNKEVKNITVRKQEFYNSLIPYLENYSKQMLKEFFEYWTEHGENDKKFRKEKQSSFNLDLRLKTWFKRSKEFKEKNVPLKKEKRSSAEIIQEELGIIN